MRGLFNARKCSVLAVALASVSAPAHAQSVGTWSLPEPDATSTPRAQGPVDAQNPVLGPTTPPTGPADAPSATAHTPAPSIAPIPVITPPPPRESENTPPPAVARPSASVSTARPEQVESPQVAPTAESSLRAIPEQAQTPAVQAESSAYPQSLGNQTGSETTSAWWWAVPAALVLAAAGVGLFLLRRRRPQTLEWREVTAWQPAPEAEPDAAPATSPTEPKPATSPAETAPLRPLPTPGFPPSPAPAAPRGGIAVDFEPVSIRLSLFYATLQYRISLKAAEACAPLELSGDLISAHGSFTQEEQLAPQPGDLSTLHTLPALAAGETAELKGEVQLPLSQIRALRRGGGSFLVPLARFCLAGEDGTALRRVFTLGPAGGGAGIVPLRIDTGPRSFQPLRAREIEAARNFPLQTRTLPLDPQRAAG